jgi:membrane protease YdiL (CAAX protease family)
MMRRMFDEAYRVLLTARSPMEYVLVVMTVAVVPAISEELLFRGLVQRNIDSVTSGVRSAIVTGVVFGLYHLNPFSFVALSVLGMFLGFLVYRSQSTTLAVIAHFFNNFVATVAVYANLDEDFLVVAPSGGATPEFVALNSAMFGVVFLAAMYYFTTLKRSQSTA